MAGLFICTPTALQRPDWVQRGRCWATSVDAAGPVRRSGDRSRRAWSVHSGAYLASHPGQTLMLQAVALNADTYREHASNFNTHTVMPRSISRAPAPRHSCHTLMPTAPASTRGAPPAGGAAGPRTARNMCWSSAGLARKALSGARFARAPARGRAQRAVPPARARANFNSSSC